jgi:ubiquinone biosynthesis protein UbiJ
MATKRLPRPRDPIALAKLIGDIATGQVEDVVEDGKDARAAGGRKGGPARAQKLTEDQRTEIARVAAAARWKRSDR